MLEIEYNDEIFKKKKTYKKRHKMKILNDSTVDLGVVLLVLQLYQAVTGSYWVNRLNLQLSIQLLGCQCSQGTDVPLN